MNKLLLACLILFAAGCNTKQEETETVTEVENTAAKTYACPMHCEGEKTYAQAGKCPICKMDLQEVALNDTDSTQHNH
ncbi:heavy metal-binding domain-containing protein [Dyadobacter sandarakinus]|uniref:Heavy metal binding domain-containing protein n=1 Tax=Dyadobacter sandarakinus TaxID=2747268 RepID=A0ABX7I8C5_9BACT|nr:heavy metal-binding domain-containing protein [Dyadobacter sandarakinus]QRR02078.1 hypothetical protein HWI92_14760 [Dyadobacter sandarakinus]